jgi:hypothetical protein
VTISASEIFAFLERHPACTIERRELHSGVFSDLRHSIRAIVARLSEDGDADSQEIADRLRLVLSEWLTVPVPFDEAMVESVAALGDLASVERRWGRDVRLAYERATAAARAIRHIENPARTQVRDAVRQLRAGGARLKIYCHSRGRAHFESIFNDEPLAPEDFLTSPKQYREVAPFDVLIKVGPLRSKGWGSAPDAVKTAPRFARLVQIVWAGCGDEEGFGYDPVGTTDGTATGTSASRGGDARQHPVLWTSDVIQVGDSSDEFGGVDPDHDDLKFFHALARASEVSRATLVQVDEDDGILYQPHAQVPAFDPAADAEEPIGYRLPGETLAEGMFLMLPFLGTVDLGALHAGEGRYSRIWKERLSDEYKRVPRDLTQRLRAAGIELRHLRWRIREWCKPASTVIHAPKERRHFEALVRVLGIEHDPAAAKALHRPWWEYAWAEIARARGEAIQTGVQKSEIIYETMFGILNSLLPELRSRSRTETIFDITLPPERLPGIVRFYKVRAIEDGFLAPDSMLREVCNLDTIEQWRV